MLLDYKNTFEGITHTIMRVEAVDGETFTITANVTLRGRTVDLSAYTVSAVYQTAAEVGVSNVYYPLEVSIVDKNAVITWTALNRINDAENYRVWLKTEKDGAISYPAIWDMYIGPSPGLEPDVIPVPPPGESGSNVVFSPILASPFDEGIEYEAGDVVSRFGKIYVTINAHTGAWNPDDFEETTVFDLIAKKLDQTDFDVFSSSVAGTFAEVSSAIADNADAINELASGVSSGFAEVEKEIGNLSSSMDEGFAGVSSSLNEKLDKSTFETYSSSIGETFGRFSSSLNEKAAKTYVDGLSSSLADSIDGVSSWAADELGKKTNASDFEAFSSTTAEKVAELESAIGEKVATSVFEAFSSSVGEALENKADKTALEGLSSSVYEEFAGFSSSLNEKVDSSTFAAYESSTSASFAELSSSIGNKADKSTVDGLSSSVNELSSSIGDKADKSTVDGLSSSVNDISSSLNDKLNTSTFEGYSSSINETIGGLSSSLGNKADASTVEGLSSWAHGEFTNVDTAINGLSSWATDEFSNANTAINGVSSWAAGEFIQLGNDFEGFSSSVNTKFTNVSTSIGQLSSSMDDKADKVSGATENHIAVLSSDGNLIDGGATVQDLKNYTDTAVATNTANFLGTYDYVDDLGFEQPSAEADVDNAAIAAALPNVVAQPTNNDYVFVTINYTTSPSVDEFRRFKFNSEQNKWKYEYTLNNSSFTNEQWAAINSGITSGKIETYEAYAGQIAQKAASSDVAAMSSTFSGEISSLTSLVNQKVSQTDFDSYSSSTTGAISGLENALSSLSSSVDAKADKSVVDGLSSSVYSELDGISSAMNDKADSSSIPTKTSDLTNDGDSSSPFITRGQAEEGWLSDWTIKRDGVDVTSSVAQPTYQQLEPENLYAWYIGNSVIAGDIADTNYVAFENEFATEISWTFTYPPTDENHIYVATRHRVCAPIPMTPSDIGAADASSVSSSLAELENSINGLSSTVAEKLDASAFETYESSMSGIFAELSSTINQKADETYVEGLSSSMYESIGKKLDSSTFADYESSMSGSLAELSSAIGTKADSSTVAELASSMSGKANTSDLNNLSSSIYEDLDGLSSSFAELSSTVDEIQPSVEKSILSQGYLFDSKQQFPEFSLSSTYQEDDLVSYNGKRWEAKDTYSPGDIPGEENLGWSEYDIDQQLSQINTIQNKINKANSFTTGNIPTFSALGDLNDSGKSPSDFALASSVSSSIADINTNLSSKLKQSAAADEWSSASSYSSGSIVVYQGLRYKCIADVAENTDWTGDTNWTPETVQQALEGIDVSSQIKGKMDANSVSNAWSDVAAYSVGDVVEYEGALYKCNTAIAAASSDSSNSWDSSLWDSTSVDIVSKLEQEAVAPVFNGASTYFANDYVTYNGVLYKCVNAKTTASNITPENDIYNASSASANHWQEVDMTSPDATVDIMTGGELRVVAADGTILWMQGYDLGSASSLSGTSMTLDNEALNAYNFVVNSTDQISLALPTAPSGKVGDFIIDIYNPSIGYAFSESSTYSSGTQAFYNGDLYSCTTAVETAGAWTGSTNWTLVASAFNSSSGYSSGTNVVYEDAIWKCQTSSVAAGAWTGTDDWQTASFIIPQWENNTIGIVVPAGEDLQEMLTFAPGTMCELYFTQTAFNLGNKPTWKVVRQDVEDGGAS